MVATFLAHKGIVALKHERHVAMMMWRVRVGEWRRNKLEKSNKWIQIEKAGLEGCIAADGCI